MWRKQWVLGVNAAVVVTAAALACNQAERVDSPPDTARGMIVPTSPEGDAMAGGRGGHGGHGGREPTTLYVWASDQARVAPDFLAVIDFDRHSRDYGKILRTVPIPPPGNVGNEAHHCHTSADGNILGCGGLLSVLKGQNDIFFFDISNARYPKFLFSTRAPNSSVTDDFFALPDGGFLVTNMGSATGGPGGKVVEFDKHLRLVREYPSTSPADGEFNPHGIDADFSRNLLVTSDFINPASTLNGSPGDPELRGSLRFWNLRERRIVRTVFLPDKAGTMDVKLIPGDPHGRAITANMFTGFVYSVDPTDGSYTQAFDCTTIQPHVEVPVRGGMSQLLAMPRSGRRLIFGLFQAGQVGMLDITNPKQFKQVSVVSFGKDAGPHSIHLSHDDKRLVITDYFLNEDDFGKIHFEGDHKVRVLDVSDAGLTVDPKFPVIDFNTAFATGPARPHGVGMK
jgi:selenium-binding protein 1